MFDPLPKVQNPVGAPVQPGKRLMPDMSSTASIELLYFRGCPSHEAFLPHLRHLLGDTGLSAPVQLVEITSNDDAQRRRFLGSPTLRINGVDVDPSATERTDYGLQCRLYPTAHGTRRAPPDAWIVRALANAAEPAVELGACSPSRPWSP